MDFLAWSIFAVTGRILIYIWQIFPLPKRIPAWLDKLHVCDLCAGVWVFSVLALAIDIDLFLSSNVIGYFATGAITSLLTHIFAIGWKAKFEVITF